MKGTASAVPVWARTDEGYLAAASISPWGTAMQRFIVECDPMLFRLPKRVHFGLDVLKAVPQGLKPSPVAYGIYGTAEAVPFVRTGSDVFRSL
jgi:hypothetical protein